MWSLCIDHDHSVKGWEETPLRQVNEGGDEIEVRLPLPAMPSSYVISFLFRSCQEIYRIGGHALDKAVLQLFASSLLEKVSSWKKTLKYAHIFLYFPKSQGFFPQMLIGQPLWTNHILKQFIPIFSLSVVGKGCFGK